MATTTKKIGFTIDIDDESIAPMSVNVFIYQMFNRLGYEHNIQSVTVDEVTVAISGKEKLYDLSLGEDKPLSIVGSGEKLIAQ